jgi:hypothetical protein
MGILANSETVTMLVSAASATGFAGGETITLSRTEPGGSLAWRLTRPGGSVAVLSSASAQSPTFVPDSIGSYVVTCVVNGITTETITLGVTSAVSPAEARSRYILLESPETVPTPASGKAVMRWDNAGNVLKVKRSDGTEAAVTGAAIPEVVDLPPKTAGDIAAPATGRKLFVDGTGEVVTKDSSGTVAPIGATFRARSAALAKRSEIEVYGTKTADVGGRTRIDLGVVDVREFCVCDGTTDDTDGFIAALETALGITAGYLEDDTKGDNGTPPNRRPLMFPEGHIRLTRTIPIRWRNVAIRGPMCGTQGGLLSSAPKITFDHADAGFELRDEDTDFEPRDFYLGGLRLLRGASYTKQGPAVLVRRKYWQSGLTIEECSGSGHSAVIDIDTTVYTSSAALARFRFYRSYFAACEYGIRTRGIHLSLSEISDSRLSGLDEAGFEGGLTGSIIRNVDFESCDSTLAPVQISGSANGDFTLDVAYFEAIGDGQACIDIVSTTNATINSLRAVSDVTIPPLQIRLSKFIEAPAYEAIPRGAHHCNVRALHIPSDTTATLFASWRLNQPNRLSRVSDLPYAMTKVGSLVDWSATKRFGDKALAARPIGTVGTPAARLGPYGITTGTINPGDAVLLVFAVRYENAALPKNYLSFVVDGRRASDSVYETSVWSANSYSNGEVETNDTIQHVLILRHLGASAYNAIRVYINTYGTASDNLYGGHISQLAYAVIPDADGLNLPCFDVPTLLEALP